MSLTYTEIEQEKSMRIWIFFAVVLIFYFFVAMILGNVTKAFFVLNSESTGRIPLFLTLKELFYILLFAFIAAAIHAAYSVSNAMPLITRNLDAQDVDASDKYHERLKRIVDEVNVATGSKYKITPIVIPTVAMNAFAISDRRKNAVIGVTEGLLSKLNRQQLEAVVAHECGHIVSGDSFQTTVGCALFGIYAAMLAGIGKIFKEGRMRSSGRGSGGIILFLLLVYLILSVMQFFYNLIRLFVSRDRELRADAIAVKLTRDPVSLSEALYSISRGWRGIGCIDRNLESLFIINPAREPTDEAEGFFADLFSTHPPVSKRIAILAAMAHADVKNIQEGVIAGEKLRNASLRVEEGEKAGWMVIDDEKGWKGPLDISQIVATGLIGPDSWIKSVGEDVIKQAKDEPLLQPFFDGKVTGYNKSSISCPKCKQILLNEEYEGVTIQRCAFCEGVLIDKDKIPRIMIRQEKGFSERLKKVAKLAQQDGLKMAQSEKGSKVKSYLKCPKCGSYMMKDYYTFGCAVEVDRCDSCKNIWFDKDELEIAQYLRESKNSS